MRQAPYWNKILTDQQCETGKVPEFSLLYQLVILHLAKKSTKKIVNSLHELKETIASRLSPEASELFINQFKWFSIIVCHRLTPSSSKISSVELSTPAFKHMLHACQITNDIPFYLNQNPHQMFKFRQLKKELKLIRRISPLYGYTKTPYHSDLTTAKPHFFYQIISKLTEGIRLLFNLDVKPTYPAFSEYCERMSHILLSVNQDNSMIEAKKIVSNYYQRCIDHVKLKRKRINERYSLFHSSIEEVKQLRLLGFLSIKKVLITLERDLNQTVITDLNQSLQRWQIVFSNLKTVAMLEPEIYDKKFSQLNEQVIEMENDWKNLIEHLKPRVGTFHTQFLHQIFMAQREENLNILAKTSHGAGLADIAQVLPSKPQSITPEESDFVRSLREKKEEKEFFAKVSSIAVTAKQKEVLRENCQRLLRKRIESEIINSKTITHRQNFNEFSTRLNNIVSEVSFIFSLESDVLHIISSLSKEEGFHDISGMINQYILNKGPLNQEYDQKPNHLSL